MALAYRFCLDTGASRGELEQALGRSLFLSADSRTGGVLAVPSTPYRADQTGDWMERFRYDLEIPPDSATFRDLRALLVARNPVSNQSPAHYSPDDINVDGYRNDMASEQPGTGERITDVRGVAPVRKAVIQRLPLREFATPPYVGMEPLNKFAAPGPNHVSVRAVPKVSINTAGFPELWRGFWGVMCMDDNTTQHPLPPVGAVVGGSPFIGNAFKPVMREDEFGTPLRMTPDEQFATDAFEAIDERNANMMFRSSIRDVRPVSPGHLPKRFSGRAGMHRQLHGVAQPGRHTESRGDGRATRRPFRLDEHHTPVRPNGGCVGGHVHGVGHGDVLLRKHRQPRLTQRDPCGIRPRQCIRSRKLGFAIRLEPVIGQRQ